MKSNAAQVDAWQRAHQQVAQQLPVHVAHAGVAEAGNHHPDLEVHWGRVVVMMQTHSAGGITEKDLQMAERIEATVQWQPKGGFPGLEGQSDGWITG